jgi:hypothetical protein
MAEAMGPGMSKIQNPVPGGLQEALGLHFGAGCAPVKYRKEAINEPGGAGRPAGRAIRSPEIH